jgi:RimJ/RimL family protein N-acetyltransferase
MKSLAIGCKCKITPSMTKQKRLQEIRSLLNRYGDIPKEYVKESVNMRNLDRWETLCDCDNGKIVAIARSENNDWYLATLKNLVTDPRHRGKGYATQVVTNLIERGKNEGVKVFAADVTFDNEASKRVMEKLGFKKVTEFCWAEGEKPAYIFHYVLIPPFLSSCKKKD